MFLPQVTIMYGHVRLLPHIKPNKRPAYKNICLYCLTENPQLETVRYGHVPLSPFRQRTYQYMLSELLRFGLYDYSDSA
jgi:hypothetical protein